MTSGIAHASTRLTETPLSPHVGVEVAGIDLAGSLDGYADALRRLFVDHHLLLFRAPDLSATDQARVAALFGGESHRERGRTRTREGEAQYVSNTRAGGLFGAGEMDFHIDHLFYPEPLRAVALYGLEVPESGGSTRFVNTLAVYEAMPQALRERLQGLRCRHARAYDRATSADWNVDDADEDVPTQIHPLLWKDPHSGRSAIWVNKLTTLGIEGKSEEEGAALMREIRGHFDDARFVYEHQWRAGDLVIWDNRVLQHARSSFDAGAERTLRRSALL